MFSIQACLTWSEVSREENFWTQFSVDFFTASWLRLFIALCWKRFLTLDTFIFTFHLNVTAAKFILKKEKKYFTEHFRHFSLPSSSQPYSNQNATFYCGTDCYKASLGVFFKQENFFLGFNLRSWKNLETIQAALRGMMETKTLGLKIEVWFITTSDWTAV